MNDSLAVYLSDHFAASRAAIDLLEYLRDAHEGEPLAEFASTLLVQVKEDRTVLNALVHRIGAKRAAALKEAFAWIGEKVTRLKMGRHASGGLGTLLALESLALGILGKQALWRALAAVVTHDHRLKSVDYERLSARAQSQHEEVEKQRMHYARTILTKQ